MKRAKKKFTRVTLEIADHTHAQVGQLADELGVSKTSIFELAVRRMWKEEFGRTWSQRGS